MFLCPVCGPSDAPRPSGMAEFTYGFVTHRTRECAAIASIGERPVRTDSGYVAASGAAVCADRCFDLGRQHPLTVDNVHWNPDAGRWQRRDVDGRWIS